MVGFLLCIANILHFFAKSKCGLSHFNISHAPLRVAPHKQVPIRNGAGFGRRRHAGAKNGAGFGGVPARWGKERSRLWQAPARWGKKRSRLWQAPVRWGKERSRLWQAPACRSKERGRLWQAPACRSKERGRLWRGVRAQGKKPKVATTLLSQPPGLLDLLGLSADGPICCPYRARQGHRRRFGAHSACRRWCYPKEWCSYPAGRGKCCRFRPRCG